MSAGKKLFLRRTSQETFVLVDEGKGAVSVKHSPGWLDVTVIPLPRFPTSAPEREARLFGDRAAEQGWKILLEALDKGRLIQRESDFRDLLAVVERLKAPDPWLLQLDLLGEGGGSRSHPSPSPQILKLFSGPSAGKEVK